MRCRCKQDEYRNIINHKKTISAFKVKEKELLQAEHVFPHPADYKRIHTVQADEDADNARDYAVELHFVGNHRTMQSDVKRHKDIIPVRGKKMCRACKAKCAAYDFCRYEPRHQKAAYQKEQGTNQNAAIHHKLHDSVRLIFSFEKRSVPSSVQHNVNCP